MRSFGLDEQVEDVFGSGRLGRGQLDADLDVCQDPVYIGARSRHRIVDGFLLDLPPLVMILFLVDIIAHDVSIVEIGLPRVRPVGAEVGGHQLVRQ